MAYQPIVPQQQQQQQQQQPYQQSIPPQYGSTANAQVVTVQPATTGTVHVYNEKKVNTNGALVLSVIVAIACGLMSPVTLCCSVPAVIMAVTAMDGPTLEERASKVRKSFILSIIALTFGLAVTTVAAILLGIRGK